MNDGYIGWTLGIIEMRYSQDFICFVRNLVIE